MPPFIFIRKELKCNMLKFLQLFFTTGVIVFSLVSLFGAIWISFVENNMITLKLYSSSVFLLFFLFIIWMRLYPYNEDEGNGKTDLS